jgi:hypothetical protein
MRLLLYCAYLALLPAPGLCQAGGQSASQNPNSPNAALLKLAHTATTDASKGDDLDAARRLLAQGANPGVRGESGRTVLMEAAGNSYVHIAELLITRGANVNAVSESGQTALMQAAQTGSAPMVKFLLKSGALLDATDKEGHTALALAALNDRSDIVLLLLTAGANPNSRYTDAAAALDLSRIHSSVIAAALREANADPVWLLHERYLVSAPDLDHGSRQVQQMVKDRPEMQKYVTPDSPIWHWCVRQFAGVSLGERLNWNKGDLDPRFFSGRYDAMNQPPSEGKPGYIEIREMHADGEKKGRKQSCEELWCHAVYELNNITYSAERERIWTAALAGRITKQSFVEQYSRSEYQAYGGTARIYRAFWKPLAAARGAPEGAPEEWGDGIASTYEEWISRYTDPSGYPWDVFGKYYDEQVVPYLSKLPR